MFRLRRRSVSRSSEELIAAALRIAASPRRIGAPTLCSVGPIGEKGHQPDEAVYLESFVPRAKAVAATILGLS